MLRRSLRVFAATMTMTHRGQDGVRRGSSDAVVARRVSLFSLSRFRQHRRTGGADHDDVQSHGGKAAVVLQGSVRQDHGFLPHASWA